MSSGVVSCTAPVRDPSLKTKNNDPTSSSISASAAVTANLSTSAASAVDARPAAATSPNGSTNHIQQQQQPTVAAPTAAPSPRNEKKDANEASALSSSSSSRQSRNEVPFPVVGHAAVLATHLLLYRSDPLLEGTPASPVGSPRHHHQGPPPSSGRHHRIANYYSTSRPQPSGTTRSSSSGSARRRSAGMMQSEANRKYDMLSSGERTLEYAVEIPEAYLRRCLRLRQHSYEVTRNRLASLTYSWAQALPSEGPSNRTTPANSPTTTSLSVGEAASPTNRTSKYVSLWKVLDARHHHVAVAVISVVQCFARVRLAGRYRQRKEAAEVRRLQQQLHEAEMAASSLSAGTAATTPMNYHNKHMLKTAAPSPAPVVVPTFSMQLRSEQQLAPSGLLGRPPRPLSGCTSARQLAAGPPSLRSGGSERPATANPAGPSVALRGGGAGGGPPLAPRPPPPSSSTSSNKPKASSPSQPTTANVVALRRPHPPSSAGARRVEEAATPSPTAGSSMGKHPTTALTPTATSPSRRARLLLEEKPSSRQPNPPPPHRTNHSKKKYTTKPHHHSGDEDELYDEEEVDAASAGRTHPSSGEEEPPAASYHNNNSRHSRRLLLQEREQVKQRYALVLMRFFQFCADKSRIQFRQRRIRDELRRQAQKDAKDVLLASCHALLSVREVERRITHRNRSTAASHIQRFYRGQLYPKLYAEQKQTIDELQQKRAKEERRSIIFSYIVAGAKGFLARREFHQRQKVLSIKWKYREEAETRQWHQYLIGLLATLLKALCKRMSLSQNIKRENERRIRAEAEVERRVKQQEASLVIGQCVEAYRSVRLARQKLQLQERRVMAFVTERTRLCSVVVAESCLKAARNRAMRSVWLFFARCPAMWKAKLARRRKEAAIASSNHLKPQPMSASSSTRTMSPLKSLQRLRTHVKLLSSS